MKLEDLMTMNVSEGPDRVAARLMNIFDGASARQAAGANSDGPSDAGELKEASVADSGAIANSGRGTTPASGNTSQSGIETLVEHLARSRASRGARENFGHRALKANSNPSGPDASAFDDAREKIRHWDSALQLYHDRVSAALSRLAGSEKSVGRSSIAQQTVHVCGMSGEITSGRFAIRNDRDAPLRVAFRVHAPCAGELMVTDCRISPPAVASLAPGERLEFRVSATLPRHATPGARLTGAIDVRGDGELFSRIELLVESV